MTGALADVFDDLEPGSSRDATVRRGDTTVIPLQRAALPARPPIPFEWANDQSDELQAPAQIVEGVLTAGGLSIFYGESNSGKTYLALHLGICVSLGLEWLGKRTQQGTVVYIAAEGAWSIRIRLAAFRKHFNRPFGHFGLVPCPMTLLEPSADMEDLITQLDERVTLGGLPPVSLIIVDTVARVMGGANENASEDMSRLVGACDRLRAATGAHVLLIHHSGKDAARGARGHSSLRAAVDTEVEVSANEATRTHTAKITKQRDLPSKGDRIAGRFVSVELGVDQWGGTITACAVEPAEAPVSSKRPRITGAAQQAVLGFLAGQALGVRKAIVVEALEPQGIARPSVYRALNALIGLGLVTDTMGLIYAPKE